MRVRLVLLLCSHRRNSDERKIIVYSSRALSTTEMNYSQLEREALTVVWSCEHFHLYLYMYGGRFAVFTDHQPLVVIFSNPESKPPARLERWSLRLQPFDVTIRYQLGAENPSDYLSRRTLRDVTKNSRQEKVAEEFVNFRAETSTPEAINLSDLKSATRRDFTSRSESCPNREMARSLQRCKNQHYRLPGP